MLGNDSRLLTMKEINSRSFDRLTSKETITKKEEEDHELNYNFPQEN